jgi:hypothetical protein
LGDVFIPTNSRKVKSEDDTLRLVPQDDPGVQWLLSSSDPSVRYLTLVDVLGVSRRSREAREAFQRIPTGPRVRALLRGQRRDGGFGVHPYAKWTGAFWRLISLVELAIPPGHPGALAAAAQVLEWLESPGHRRTIHGVDGRVRQHAAQEGFALAVCCRLGMGRLRRVRALADSMLLAQWPDGGWNCDPDPDAVHSSFHETFAPVWGLAEFDRATGDRDARKAAERGAELLLKHGLFRSHRTGEIGDRSWLKLRYPPYWHYDVLQGLVTLSRVGKLHDGRAGEALDIVRAKRRPDGCWRAEGYHWKPPGASGSNVEAVDWGRGGPSEMLTVRALTVLRATGR